MPTRLGLRIGVFCDHTLVGVSLIGPMLFSLPRLGIGMFIWALLVGVARIAAGLHYPSDIIGTSVLAFGIDVLAMRVVSVMGERFFRGQLP